MPRHSVANDQPTETHIGQQLRRFRLLHGLSQTNVAEAAGMSAQMLQRYEVGANRVTASMLMRLAKILQCSTADLLPPDGTRPEENAHAIRIRNNSVNAKIFELIPRLNAQQRTTLLQIATSFASAEQNP